AWRSRTPSPTATASPPTARGPSATCSRPRTTPACSSPPPKCGTRTAGPGRACTGTASNPGNASWPRPASRPPPARPSRRAHGTRQRLGLTADVQDSPTLKSDGGLSLDAVVKFNWQIALGEHALTLRELETLARLKSPLVKVRGQWVQVRAEELQAALDFWKK